jgi:hypothetical protein
MEAVVTDTRTRLDAGISLDAPKRFLLNLNRRFGNKINDLYDDFMLAREMRRADKEPGFVSEEEIMEILRS